jgi:diguanylate cyclase (GGDEF)-like protein/PAS domain S-box-containing protein
VAGVRDQAEANLSALIESTEDLIWSVDLDYGLLTYNKAFRRHAERNLGIPAAIGKRPQDFLSPEKAAIWPPLFERALSQGPFRTELPFADARTLEVAFNPIVVEGKITGVSVFGKDITERKRTAEALAESEARFRGIFERNGSVMLLVEPSSGAIVDANRAASAFYGYSPEQLIGMPISRINTLPPDQAPLERERGLREERNHFDFRHRLASGEVRDVEVYSSPIDIDGKPLLFSVVCDVTGRKRTEESLRESADSLREAQRIGGLGCYTVDIPAGVWKGSEILDEIFGIDGEYEHSVAGWVALIHPADRAMMTAYFVDEVLGEKKPFDKEYRIIRQTDRAERWVRGRGRLEFDAQGRPATMHGVIKDVTERKQAERQIRESEERYRESFEQVAIGIIHTALDGRILRSNARFAEIVGYSLEELTGLTIQQITAPEDLNETIELLQRMLAGAVPPPGLEKRYARKDGSRTWVKLTLSTQRDAEGRALHYIVVVEDIDARKTAEERLAKALEALQAGEERYRAAFQTSQDAISMNRLSDGVFIDVNRAFLEITGFQIQELLGQSSLDIAIWANPADRLRLVETLRQNASHRDLKAQFRRKNGEVFWGLMSASIMELDGVPCILSITRDLTDATAAEEEIKSLAFYDPLTRLPNRRLLLDRLHQALIASARSRRQQALLFIDLDNFKTLNDTLGHRTGDLLLLEVARRISACIRDADTVARLGGDEFVVMLEDLSETPEEAAAQAQAVGEKILAAIGQPWQLGGRECLSTSSIGITIFGDQQQGSDEILQQADIAMYQAKAAGRNTMRFFAPALQTAVNARAAMEGDIRQGLKTNQFLLFYQPGIERTRLMGAEALIRWNHPTRGLLSPDLFIPLAEETGLILPLGDWVLETACAQLAIWAGRKEAADLLISVNISARQFRQPEFVERVLSALDRTGADPQRLTLELTETMLLNDVEDTITKMTALKARGLRFALDDFGTGYSSLSYLKRLPLDQLKIDRSFVRDILLDISSGAIAQAVISLGRAMGLSVIAEGVETEEQRDFLARLGCHAYQGYLFGRPLPLEQFEQLWICPAERAAPSAA